MRKGGVSAKISIIWGGRHYYRIFFSEASQASFGKKRDDEVSSHQTSVYNIVSFGGVRYILKGCDARVAIQTGVNCTHLVDGSKFHLRTKKTMIQRLTAFALVMSLKNPRGRQIKFRSKSAHIGDIIHNHNPLPD
jgi:hypothetical protein